MINIIDLERRWLKYKIKSYLPLALGATGTSVALIFALIYLPTSTDDKKEVSHVQEKPIVIQTPLIKEKKEPISIAVPQNTAEVKQKVSTQGLESLPEEKPSDTLVLRPSLHFMDNIEDGISPYLEEDYALTPTPVQSNVAIEEQKQNTAEQTTTSFQQQKEDIPVVKNKPSGLSITANNNQDDLKDVIRRFKKNKNPALSLFIAKRYYNEGKYQQSYNYALMTNEIDKTIDDSWLIFAKSLVKLGQNELAINTLKSYVKTTKSSTAKVLLKKIEAGTFK